MESTGPLKDIKVLDFCHVLAGPFGSELLGDLGADVIRVESPQGDQLRGAIPPSLNGESSYYFSVNRNKRCISLDLKKPESIGIIRRMAAGCDVVMENFRPGVMDRLGIGYEDLKAIQPDLIYASLSAFGKTGPYRDRPGYELIIQALTGLVDITTPRGGPPSKIQVQIVDLCSGMFLTIATLGALYHKLNTGEGQQVETSLLKSTLAMTANLSAMYLMSGKVPTGMASRNPQKVPSQVFKSKDGVFALVDSWEKFCRAIGKDEWIDDPDMSRNDYRVENYDRVVDMIEAVTKTRTTEEWLEIFASHDVAANRVNTMEEAFSDPGVQATEMVRVVNHSRAGEIRILDKPWEMSKTPGEIRYPPPALGEHTSEILKEWGYSAEEIGRLWEKEVIFGE